MTTTTTTRPEICEGVRFLDTEYPEWLEAIDLDQLDLESNADCVLGQLAETITGEEVGVYVGYVDALRAMFPSIEQSERRSAWAEEHGFVVLSPTRYVDVDEEGDPMEPVYPDDNDGHPLEDYPLDAGEIAYQLLTAEWRQVIEAKRAGEDDGCR